jgi:hypothetical protein
MDTGKYQMNAVEVPVAVDTLKVLNPFQKKSMSALKFRCEDCLLVDDATTGDYFAQMDPELVGEHNTEDSRAKYPEVVDPLDRLVSCVDLLFRVSGSTTERSQEKGCHRSNESSVFNPRVFIIKHLESWPRPNNVDLATPKV